MNYSTEIIVEVPLDVFIKKMDNADNMKHWQRSLTSYEHISGTPGEFGAKMKLNFLMGKRKLELIETITKRNFPHEFHANYVTKGVDNHQENYFEATREGYTKWTSKSEFIPLGFGMKLLTVFMQGVFKKQSYQYMKDFKNFAEKGISVSPEASGRQLKLIWDFRGAEALRIAEHHHIHLKEYIAAEDLNITVTGFESLSDLHAIAFLVVDESEMKPIRDALKPHRGQVYIPS